MLGRIVLVGSGETSPTMVKLHRALIDASPQGTRVMLDTPFGFQTNAEDLTGKIRQYFADSVGVDVAAVEWRRPDAPLADRERALSLLGKAAWVFAGPGSPSYALRLWADTPVPEILDEVVRRGGTVVLGSAAAVTAGAYAVPVYEIYKVGEEPRWLPGLNLLGDLLGLEVAVIPHFDNREGGRHDTRFCYLGEERLEVLEAQLPASVGILGVDEHTAAVFDLDARTATVHGAGSLTVRWRGAIEVVPSGQSISLTSLSDLLAGSHRQFTAIAVEEAAAVPVDSAASLIDTVRSLQERFRTSLEVADADGALQACLELEDAMHAWSADTLQSDEMAVARRALREMIVDLAGAAREGLADPKDALGPIVTILLELRRRARLEKDFTTSDFIRDGLAGAAIEVKDTPDGQVWSLHER